MHYEPSLLSLYVISFALLLISGREGFRKTIFVFQGCMVFQGKKGILDSNRCIRVESTKFTFSYFLSMFVLSWPSLFSPPSNPPTWDSGEFHYLLFLSVWDGLKGKNVFKGGLKYFQGGSILDLKWSVRSFNLLCIHYETLSFHYGPLFDTPL